MRLPVLALLTAAPALATPELVPHVEGDVSVALPRDWRILVDARAHNVTANQGLFTTLTMYWYPWKPGATTDIVLDVVLRTTNDSLPFGAAIERSRTPALDGRGALLDADYVLLGYRMKIGVLTLLDPPKDRILAAVLLTDPASWDELDGPALLAEVADSFALATDPRYLPDPRAPGPELVWRALPEDLPYP